MLCNLLFGVSLRLVSHHLKIFTLWVGDQKYGATLALTCHD